MTVRWIELQRTPTTEFCREGPPPKQKADRTKAAAIHSVLLQSGKLKGLKMVIFASESSLAV